MQMNVHLINVIAVIFGFNAKFVVLDEPNQAALGVETATGNLTNQTGAAEARRRKKRFDYEDTYEWEDDDDLTYEGYYQDEEEEPNLFQKLALRWRSAGPRIACLMALCIIIILVCCSCCRLLCRAWCKSMGEQCACCGNPGVKMVCQMCYTDPMYERVKDLGEIMGIEITFNTFERIRDNYMPDTGYNQFMI